MESSRSRIGYGLILSVLFGVLAIGLFIWILGLSADLEREREARVTAQTESELERVARQQADTDRQSAETRARDEADLRATAEAIATREITARQDAVAARERAESDRDEAVSARGHAETERSFAEQLADMESMLRATAEAETEAERLARQTAELQLRSEQMLREDAEDALRAGLEAASETIENERANAERELALELARTNTTVKAIATGELNFYIEPLPWYAADGVEDAVDDIVDLLEGWGPHGAHLSRTTEKADADIYVRWIRDYGGHTLGQAIHQSVIHVGLGSTNCNDEWQAFDADTVKKILWHEFGHAFGYGHSDDPNNVMYPTTETRFEVEQSISRVVAAGWIWRFPLCSAGRYSIEFEADGDEDGFDVVVVREYVDWDDYHEEDYEAYRSCVNGRWHRVTQTCDVESGAYIYIQNYDWGEAIRLSGQIIQLDDPPWPNMQWDEDAFYYDEETLDYYRELFEE